ncbi:TPA: hypothetical protein KD214_003610 [Acinetobacter baumannii]|uniref:hypothetical protein n=2 Tax=Acinetobacter baumannii TaxID=470 RepID=UPI001B8166AF|nr:hypothetical protein [Acinetobacter baumannii]WCF71525.1 hypothetical protein Acba1_027 [Acinetobacter phage Acba_1]WCF71900.1 hypothetical protein ACBA15_019 [Acinetobacter phage Acba_15]WDS61488.1 hypothetical protein AClW8_012 [Acinetobacter phage Aclw_8]HAV7128211.1 hypothetical protein [Acinetobacter baumannii]HBC3620514.1 hypothetical protein [Acinetobacter baumannii]
MTFDEAIQQHKDNLTKNLSEFGEGHRLNRLHKEIDSNAADYEYYFNAGQQAQQAKVEELQTLYTQQGINMLKMQKRVDAVIIEIENMYLSGAIGFDTVKKLEQALKGE